MEQRIKNGLGIAIIASILMVGFSAMSYVSSYGKAIQPSAFRSFSVSGDGKVVAVPDVAQFTFSVISEGGKDIVKLQEDNTAKTNAAIAFVKGKGVNSKDIKTDNYNLSPRYQYCDYSYTGVPKTCPPPEIIGYTITQTVSVKIREGNFSKIGEVLSGVINNGANETSQLSFRVDDPTTLQDQARAMAIAKAKVSAEATAKAGGFRLGRLLSIDENSYYPFRYEAYGKGGATDVSNAPAPMIEPGSQDITSTVTLRYEIN